METHTTAKRSRNYRMKQRIWLRRYTVFLISYDFVDWVSATPYTAFSFTAINNAHSKQFKSAFDNPNKLTLLKSKQKQFIDPKTRNFYRKVSQVIPISMKSSKEIFDTVSTPSTETSASNLSPGSYTDSDGAKIKNSKTGISTSDRALGLLVLMTVPCAWGTFAPVVRYVYEMETPVPGFVFSSGYYLVASLSLNFLLWLQGWKSNYQVAEKSTITKARETQQIIMNSDTSGLTKVSQSPWSNMPIMGGLELGMYLFLGNCFQVVGLETVSADRAAFLVQLTTVFVPLLQAFLYSFGGEKNEPNRNFFSVISPQTWCACLLAFTGVVVMELDNGENTLILDDKSNLLDSIIQAVSSISSIGIGWGDICVLAAALAYTFHVVRLSKYANETTPLQLASCKATTEAVLSISLVGILWSLPSDISYMPSLISSASQDIHQFFQSYPSFMMLPSQAFFACLWTGWVTCAYTIYAQSFGQKRVTNPTFANLIYTTQPLFSAAFAWWLLDETLGFWGFAGGGLIGAALALITLAEGKEYNSNLKKVDSL